MPTRSIWVKHAMDKSTARQKVEVLDSPPDRFNDIVTVQDGGAFQPVVELILDGKGKLKRRSLSAELARRREVAHEGDDEDATRTGSSHGRRLPVESHLSLLRKHLLPDTKPHACHVRWMRGQVKPQSQPFSIAWNLPDPNPPQPKPQPTLPELGGRR